MQPDKEPLSDLRRGFNEFWLFVRRRPVHNQAWRDFWITWIPGFLPFFVVLMIVDPPFFSITMLVALVGTGVWALVIARLFVRFGVVGGKGRGQPH